ncbi:MAG: (Fe-S)-binding protein, partial [Thermodesulfovibrionia bacterium]|nr:(Fe-S)-binding protein [Thermodesulfovibrionia bacterium]
MAKIEVPELTGNISVPKVKQDASKDMKPFLAKPDLMKKLAFPPEKAPDWKEKFLQKMDEILKKYRSVRVFLDSCVRCGACTDKCHYYLGTGDPRNMPVYRQELMRSVYRRYFTMPGKAFRKLAGTQDLTDDLLELWMIYYYQCSECRRCSVFCP